MLSIAGFELKETIYQSGNTTILKGVCNLDALPVIIKIFNKEQPGLKDLARFKKEFEITKSLKGDCIVNAISLEKHHHS